MQSLLLTVVAGLFTVGGIAIGLSSTNNKKFIDFWVGAALSVIVMVIIFELFGEAYEHAVMEPAWRTYLFIAILAGIGFLILNILDKIIPHHNSEHEHDNLRHIGILTSIAIILHNIMEGMTLYVTSSSDISAGYLLCLGIGLHNIPIGIMIAGMLRNKKQLAISCILLTISTFIGGLIMHIVGPIDNELIVGILISLTIGMLIFIIIHELLGQVRHSKNKLMSWLGVFIGIFLVAISLILA